MGFCELLTVIFIVLKLCGVIAWPWLYVLSPMILVVVLFVAIWVVTVGVFGVIAYLGSK